MARHSKGRPGKTGRYTRAGDAKRRAKSDPEAGAPESGTKAVKRSGETAADGAASARLERASARPATLATATGRGRTTVIGRDPAASPIRPGWAIGPALRESIERDLAMPPPLLMLPMRLEYRVVDLRSPIRVSGAVAGLFKDDPQVSIERAQPPAGPRRRTGSADRAAGRWKLDPAELTFQDRREIWFRWFPDDGFSFRGVPPITEFEEGALRRFAEASGGKPWHMIDDTAVRGAWHALSREIAPERALFLLRHPGGGDPAHADVQGALAMLPEQVVLFALDAAGVARELGRGVPIDPNLRYSVAGLQPEGWLTDFHVALKTGMALRLADERAVATALAASWIIAVGLFGADASPELTALLEDRVANGEFEFLPQDTATNNAPGVPSPYRSSRADLDAFLKSAVAAESGVLASPLVQAAELFAEAVGIEVSTVARAPGSADLAYEDARAMLRVVGPALIDTAVERTASLAGIDEEEVVEVFAEAMMARGPLPPVRFGKNPYGLLPVTKLAGLQPLASDGDNVARIEGFIRTFAETIVEQSQMAADATVPVLEPGDPDASQKLDEILKTNPTSRRIEVSSVGQSDAKTLGCAYVSSKAHPVGAYLPELQREPIAKLADPTASDASWPLLYRLARLSLSKSTVLKVLAVDPVFSGIKLNLRVFPTPSEEEALGSVLRRVEPLSLGALASRRPPGFSDVVGRLLQRSSAQFLAGLKRLEEIAAEPEGEARLETLLMETIDLFQHRMDAWATGLAYRRITLRRRAGMKGLAGGHWGMLGKLRPQSVTGRTDGYLQAPSMQQAVTAALLRSAYLRHGGAFAVGLDSRRVRRGLRLLEILQAGIGPGEALGYLAERTLHDRRQDVLVSRLRDLFPIRDPRDDNALEIRLVDGLRFLKADIATMVPAAEAAPLQALQATLREHFDALSDIVMAEAAHLRGMGQADASNAWLQVLSGETIPGLPSVLRTRRNGHGSSHRVAVLLDPVDPQPGDPPRALAEPTLAAMASQHLAGFASGFTRVLVGSPDQGPPTSFDVALGADLGLAPIDLVVGGESEVLLRARHHLLARWRDDPTTVDALGPLPAVDLVNFINRVRPVTIDIDVGNVRTLLAQAAELRRAVAQGRMLEPGDLSAAADPALPLQDAMERDLIAASASSLAVRADLLSDRMNADRLVMRDAMGAAIAAARNLRRRTDEGADAAELALLGAELEALHSVLDAALVPVSRYGEPGALHFIGSAEIAADPDDFEGGLAEIAARLEGKAARLTAALSPNPAPSDARGARAFRDALIASLKGALDGDAQPVLAPFARTPETTPLVGAGTSAATALAEWQPARARVRRMAALFGQQPWLAHASGDAATGADDLEADPRTDEGLAPRARLFGQFIARGDPASATGFAGFVADEWAEQRPSRMQQTGISINYDSPQNEFPQALLLCEPSGPRQGPWSAESAAAMVAETIRLMKTRAVAAQDRPMLAPLFPAANQIPFKQVRREASAPRIPVAQYKFVGALNSFVKDVSFLQMTSVDDVGIAGAGFNEISGFGKVRE